MLDELNPPAIYGEAVAGRSAKVRESLLRLSANINASVADMVELLTEAVENNYLPAWGFSSVLEYGTEELGLKKRKTQYLTRIGKVTKAVGLTRSQWEPAGTSKLREICTLDPEGSYWNIAEHANEDMAEHIVRLILDCDKLTVKKPTASTPTATSTRSRRCWSIPARSWCCSTPATARCATNTNR